MDIVKRQLPGHQVTPPGVVPNYINPPWRGREVVVASAVLSFMATISVIARLVTKRCMRIRYGWDDYLIVPALLLAIGRTVANSINATHYDLGIHIWDIKPDRLTHIGNLQKNTLYVADMLYLIAIMFTKESILVFYLRIFGIKRWFRITCIFMMVLVAIYCWLFFFLYAFNCTPEWVTWHTVGYTGDGYCRDNIDVNFSIGGVNILTDLILLVLPLPVTAQLQLDRKKKWALLLVFATGIFVWGTTIAREVIVVKTLRNIDQTWVTVPQIIWLTVELNVGIVCANLPSLSPLLRSQKVHRFVYSLRSLLPRRRSVLSGVSASECSANAREPGQSKFNDKSHIPQIRDTDESGNIMVSTNIKVNYSKNKPATSEV